MKNVVQYVCCKPAVPKEPCHVLGDKGECGFRSLVLRGGHRCKRHSTKHRSPLMETCTGNRMGKTESRHVYMNEVVLGVGTSTLENYSPGL